jgi:hypothetical protein
MDVAAHLQQIIIPVYQERLVALFEYVPAAMMAPIVIHRVARLKWLHQFREIPLRSLQQKMDVIGQKAVTKKRNLLELTVVQQPVQVPPAVAIVFEDVLTIVAAANHVIDSTGILYAKRACHTRSCIPSAARNQMYSSIQA